MLRTSLVALFGLTLVIGLIVPAVSSAAESRPLERDRSSGLYRAPALDLQALRAGRVPEDENWWDGFGSPGLSGTVNDMIVYDGALIVTGEFEFAEGVRVNRIARWDGTSWSSLGAGLDGTGWRLHIDDGKLVVGGWFYRAGGVEVRYIAQWDGAAWSAIGEGFDWAVLALATYQNSLVAAGEFNYSGGAPVRYIARWTGTVWEPMGDANGSITGLHAYLGDLVASGYFDQIGGVPVSRIARYSGIAWDSMGEWDDPPDRFIEKDGILYCGAWIGTAWWNGTEWVDLGCPTWGPVGLGVYEGNLIRCGDTNDRVYSWNGVEWSLLGRGLGHEFGRALAVFDGKLYAGGFLFSAGDQRVLSVASWDGESWAPLGPATGQGVGGRVNALSTYQGDVVAAGRFPLAGDTPARNIARWDGSSWHALGDGVSGWANQVHALLVYGGELIVAGDFEYAGGIRTQIARWNGSQWLPIGGGVHCGRVNALAEYQGDLIAVGDICLWGGQTAWRILRWNGVSWQGIGDWPETCEPRSVTVWNDCLVVGGCFTNAQGAPGDHVAIWNGQSWGPMEGLNGDVLALASYNGTLVAGGWFNIGGGANGIAKWDGASWGPIGGDAAGVVHGLAVVNGDLYACGEIDWAGGQPVSGIARYDGAVWAPLGSGLNRLVYALTADEDPTGRYLYAGGDVMWAGDGKPSAGIARWRLGEATRVPEEIEGLPATVRLAVLGPNPGNGRTTLAFALPHPSRVNLGIYDLSGRLVDSLIEGFRPAGPETITWNGRRTDGGPVPSGVYLARLQFDGMTCTRRLLILR